MALKDLMEKTAKAASGSVAQGFMGNSSEVSENQLQQEYGKYLMNGEVIQKGYKLIRDVFIVTDRRIIDFDKQGATGKKMSVKSIFLSSIINVETETAGFGLDDSEITITYITTPYHKAHAIDLESRKFEFPKKYDITELYHLLQETAYENYCRINR